MSHRATESRLRRAALRYPDAREEFPWGERVVKVRGRIFVFLGVSGGELHVTAKLPLSGEAALGLPFAAPTGYNLGKSGWVSASFGKGEDVPEPLLLEWIEESYRAVAPKGLVKLLDAPAPAPGKRPARPAGARARKTAAPARQRR